MKLLSMLNVYQHKLSAKNIENFNKILDDARNYLASDIKDATSSFWKPFVRNTILNSIGNFIIAAGYGFGDFVRNDMLNKWRLRKVVKYCNDLQHKLPKKYMLVSKIIQRKQKRLLTFDLVKALHVVHEVESNIKIDNKRICIIGDGYATVGCVIRLLYPSVKLVFVNLPTTLAFDFLFSTLSFGPSTTTSYNIPDDKAELSFFSAESTCYKQVKDIDLFINVASMQEMTLSTVQSYLNWMREQNRNEVHFYCCNRVEKSLPDGEVLLFSEYGWSEDDYYVLDGKPDWYEKFPIVRHPYIQYFDGPFLQRLAKLNKTAYISSNL